MSTSQARIDANLKNSHMSTGPRTPEGKRQSRRNGLKHGLTGEGIVLFEDDAARVELRVEEFEADLAPRSSVGKFLVRQMATLSIRMERSAEQESAAISARVLNAVEEFDQARFDEADRLLDLLGEEPRVHLRKLRKSPEGVERLIVAWRELRSALTRDPRPTWTAWHRERAENLTGLRIDDASGSEIGVLSKAAWGDFGPLEEEEEEVDLDNEVRKAQGRAQLVQRIDAEIAQLEEHYETLDFDRIDLVRAGAPKRALFDSSPEAILARRYESEASRRFFKAMNDLQQVEAEAADRPAVAPILAPETPYGPMASSWDRPAPTPRDPQPTPARSRPVADDPRSEPVGRPETRTRPLGTAPRRVRLDGPAQDPVEIVEMRWDACSPRRGAPLASPLTSPRPLMRLPSWSATPKGTIANDRARPRRRR